MTVEQSPRMCRMPIWPENVDRDNANAAIIRVKGQKGFYGSLGQSEKAPAWTTQHAEREMGKIIQELDVQPDSVYLYYFTAQYFEQ